MEPVYILKIPDLCFRNRLLGVDTAMMLGLCPCRKLTWVDEQGRVENSYIRWNRTREEAKKREEGEGETSRRPIEAFFSRICVRLHVRFDYTRERSRYSLKGASFLNIWRSFALFYGVLRRKLVSLCFVLISFKSFPVDRLSISRCSLCDFSFYCCDVRK